MLAKYLLLPLLALSLAASPAKPVTKTAGTDVTMENEGDGFYLSDVSYESSESFVYTAVANFEYGQAAALVIGGSENDHYWAFNIDRIENKTKLLYFYNENDSIKAKEYYTDYFIGNDKTTQSEFNVINSKLKDSPRFHLKLVVTVEEEKTFVEFFVDNIKRFGVDTEIDLNTLSSDYNYEGGYIGFNVFNGKVRFSDITYGKSDYSYYSELYRNQYHFSQFSHWNNDPNGLVYYNGYYHMFFQTHPFSKTWSDMYWGHARSKDLVHWQELPIALFPDDGNMGKGLGVGYAWSGIAMVYHQGMSDYIDNTDWFPTGEGLIGYFTRDSSYAQDQLLITSTDEGLTWIKRDIVVSQYIIVPGGRVDCRDPSIFPLQKDGDKVTKWGMVLSGGTYNKIWFLKSSDMFHWDLAGGFDYIYPECVTVKELPVSGTEESHYVMSVSSRHYTIGDFAYDGNNITFHRPDGQLVSQSDFVKMEYGEDSYAAQCFYIDDETSEYYGKSVSVSWFSGLPSDAESGIYQNVRDPWNGGGMTIPVELGIDKVDGQYLLTQKPITISNTHFEKENIISKADITYDGSENVLDAVNTHIFELDATIDNPNEESLEFKVAMSDDEYTLFGWNKEEGYFIDRAHTSDAGIDFKLHYHGRFTTGPTLETKRKTFYVLCDNGGLELFCGDFRYNFYNLILPSPVSIGAEFSASGNVTFESLTVNSISSIWYDELEEGKLYVDKTDIALDLNLHSSEEFMAFSSNGEDISYEITSGADVVSVTKTNKGAKVDALRNGVAFIKVSTANEEKDVKVTVDNANVDCFFTLKKENIVSGTWLTTSKGLVGNKPNGDGYILSDVEGWDFTYSASFDLTSATAAGLLLRASSDLSDYIMVNYDKNEHVCKMWTPRGMIATAEAYVDNPANVVLLAKATGRNISLSVNGNNVINVTIGENDPLSGYLGLNVFSGKVTFTHVNMLKEEYVYDNDDLVIIGNVEQYIYGVYNINKNNELISKSFYKVEGNRIIISESYFELLDEHTLYEFYIEGELSSFTVKVQVNDVVFDPVFFDEEINEGLNFNLYVGKLEVTSVSVNAKEVTYVVKDYTLTIYSNAFKVGNNKVVINDEYTLNVKVLENKTETVTTGETTTSSGCGGSVMTTSVILSVLSIAGVSLLLVSKKGKKNER